MKKDARKKKLKVVINEDKFLSPKQCRRKGEVCFHGLSVHCDTINSVVSTDVRRGYEVRGLRSPGVFWREHSSFTHSTDALTTCFQM